MKPIVAIVGRPNVGKSMLFNRLMRPAAVYCRGYARRRPGTGCMGSVSWNGRPFTLIDTGGIEPRTDNQILEFMREQAEIAIDNATVIVFLTDIKTGLTASDHEVANMLLRSGKPIVLAVNKMDSTGAVDPDFYEFYNLGLGDPIAVSAVHGHGTGDLLDACVQYFPPEEEEEEEDDAIKVAVIGKPNAGKSSLVNKILGEERVIVSNVAGTTRDAIDSRFENDKGSFVFIDTAGIRKKSKVDDPIERYASCGPPWPSSAATCVSSSSTPMRVSRSRIPRWRVLPMRQARPVSSWSTSGTPFEKDDKTMDQYEDEGPPGPGVMSYAPILFISAITGQRVDRLFDMIDYVNATRPRCASPPVCSTASWPMRRPGCSLPRTRADA